DRASTKRRDLRSGVGHHQDRLAIGLELADTVDALLLERGVADSQHLVDDEDVRVDVDRYSKTEPDIHTRRVVLHRAVDELCELAELDDLVEQAIGLGPWHAKQSRVE